ncbi:MAG: Hpt domain-containing protein [Thermoguttaceae bacterium]|nr:Hpt domain-containing protein [Thermoguttaceae bacterium]MDW8038805.1 Hpt domain-containing protein [Thermoguttaceae bacterium]
MSSVGKPDRDEFYETLLGDFLDESAQLLDRLNENLLKLDEWAQNYEDQPEAHCDEDLLNEMFRAAHSLKGLSAMLGLQEINQLTHKVENVFDAARKQQLRISRDVVSLIFEAVDQLAALIEALKQPDAQPVEYEAVLEKIHQLLRDCGAERSQSTQADAERALALIEQGLQSLAEPTTPSAPEVSANLQRPADQKVCDVQDTGLLDVREPNVLTTDCSPNPLNTAKQIAPLAACLKEDSSQAEEQMSAGGSADLVGTFGQPTGETLCLSELPDPLAAVEDEATLPTKYVGIFIDEATDTLDQMTEMLLATEGTGQKETLEQLMVLAHKLKGAAASIGLARAAKLAHLMEDLLQGLLGDQGVLNPRLTDTLLRATDALRQFVETLRQGQPRTEHFGLVARELLAAQQATPSQPAVRPPQAEVTAFQADAKMPPSAEPSCGPETGPDRSPNCLEPPLPTTISSDWRQKVISNLPEGARAILGEVYLEKDLPLVGLKGRLIYEKLCRLGELCQFDPPPERLEETEPLEKISFALLTEQPISAVENQLRIAGVRGKVLEIWPPLQHPPFPSPNKAAASGVSTGLTTPPGSTGLVQDTRSASKSEAVFGYPQIDASKQPASSPPGSGSGEPSSAETAKPTETLRVDIERLDELMNLAGQLVINKARFNRISESLKGLLSGRNPLQMVEKIFTGLEVISQTSQRHYQDAQKELEGFRATARRIQQHVEELSKELQLLPRVRQAIYELQEAVHQLDRVTDGLQQTVMQTRMVPIGPLFTRFKRVVRDITRLNGKSARLVILGEKTELDKRMIDELGDPLIHLVRNALDHGIEPPDVRESLGKPRQGTVTLEAYHRGNSIVIRVSDDGRGLDADKILKKAIEKGLVNPADAEKMTRQQIYQLIWQPGLSTAEKVTEISGRGMGMDIVLAKISELNGTIEIDSTPGVGTTMTIKLPLTLAILPSLMIQIDGDTFALPIEAVAEIVHLKRSDLYTIQGRCVARVRNAVISVVDLRELFTWNQPGANSAKNSQQTTLVILGDTGRQIGLAVDQVLGEEDVVIKSIAENYRNVPGLAGASILGDGRVALILDVTALLEMASGRHSMAETPMEFVVQSN